jgi:hypothetical protein
MSGMLANLLPGLRDLRGPLAAGYVWLAVGWLLFGRQLPAKADANGVLADVYEIGGWLGRPALLVVASFAAYLLGILSSTLSKLAIDALFPWRYIEHVVDDVPRVRTVLLWAPVSARDRRFVRDWLTSRLSQRGEVVSAVEGESAWLGPREMSSRGLRIVGRNLRKKITLDARALKELFIDLEQAPAQLIGKDPDLFNTFDRMRGEAEFRAVVSLPLVALFIALAASVDPRWLAGIVPSLLLLVQARNHYQSSGNLLAEAVKADRLKLTILEPATTTEPDPPSQPAG